MKQRRIWAVQFHPEVAHTKHGMALLKNFAVTICGCKQDWTPEHFIATTVARIREQVGPTGHAICGLSGGVDSSVAAVLVARAIGDRLTCIFVNNGVLRKDEFATVQKTMRDELHLNVVAVDAGERFLTKLAGVTDPETKRKIIGNEFIAVFDDEAKTILEAEKAPAPPPEKKSRGSSRARSTRTSSSPPASTAPRTSSRATTTSAACPRT